MGDAPDEYGIETWVGKPAQTVPETGDRPFTRSVQDFVERFVAPRARQVVRPR